ncbi:MAG: hypothetical protein V1837_05820 [Candidatus Woesearchaeota archaeon]
MKKDLNSQKVPEEEMGGKGGFLQALFNQYGVAILIIVLLLIVPISNILVVTVTVGSTTQVKVSQKSVSLLSYIFIYGNVPSNYFGDTPLTITIDHNLIHAKMYDLNMYKAVGSTNVYQLQDRAFAFGTTNTSIVVDISQLNFKERFQVG